MKIKTLLITVMSFVATAMMAQATAYAVYCGENDNTTKTLYFLTAETAPVKGGKYSDGQTITEFWSGDKVTATGGSYPQWNQDGYSGKIMRVVFEESFKKVNPTSCSYWFNYCRNLKTIEGIENLNTSELTQTINMFNYCDVLESLDLSNFDTQNVKDMSNMFSECKALKTLNLSGNFNTTNVKDMSNMFNSCEALTTLTLSDNFNTTNVENMSNMFSYCYALKTLNLSDNFNTTKVTDMNNMFNYCDALTTLTLSDNFNTTNVENMSNMFSCCKALKTLNLSNFNTQNVTNMNNMFSFCYALKTLNISNFNTTNVTDMSYMFSECRALESLDLSNFNTQNVTDMSDMFNYCEALMSLDLRKVDNAVEMINTGNFEKRGMVMYLPETADVSDYVFEENFVIKPETSTSFARTFTEGNMSTVCLPFEVNTTDTDIAAAGTFYKFKECAGNTVKFEKIKSGNTVANKAYLFKPATSNKVTFTGEAIENLPTMTEDATSGMYGVYTNKVFTKDEADANMYYGWHSGDFVKIAENATVKPGRAYLKLASASEAKSLKAVFDDETTGISDVNAAIEADNAPAYDLTGRRVSASYKGLVIKNRKKYIK